MKLGTKRFLFLAEAQYCLCAVPGFVNVSTDKGGEWRS